MRLPLRPGCAIGCLALPSLVFGLPLVALLRHPVTSGKYEPVDGRPAPSSTAVPIVAEVQDEPHTDGPAARSTEWSPTR